jgi:hypothetical protein
MDTTWRLTDDDLRFVAETVGAGRSGAESDPAALRWREDLLDVLLDDDRLVARLLADDHALVRVSPRFVFSVLLRRVVRDLRERPYTLERTPAETVAVFDAPRLRRFIAEPTIWSYLVTMLTAFVRTETVTVWVRQGRRYARRRFNTLSLDDMVTLVRMVDPEEARPIFRRIADIALFTSGIFPDFLRTGGTGRAPEAGRARAVPPTLDVYEEHGRRFYRLAAEAEPGPTGRVLEALADEFPMARKSLEILSDRYLRWTRLRWFPSPG